MVLEPKRSANEFKKHTSGPWDIWLREPELGDSFLEMCCREPKTEAEGFQSVKCGKDSEVYRFEFNGRVFFLKEFLCRGWQDRLKDMFRPSRAWRALAGEHTLRDAGLCTPPIIVIGEYGARNVIVTEEVPDAMDLYFMIRTPEKYPLPPHQFADRVGALIGTLHANNISHGDLRWGNILLNGSGDDLAFYFIDNERTVQYKQLPDRLRVKNLVQMAMSTDHLSDYLVLRFWSAYLRKNPHLRKVRHRLATVVMAKTKERRGKDTRRRA